VNKISDTKPEYRYGIFAGIGTIIFFSVLWLSFPRQAFGLPSFYVSILIYLIFMLLAVNEINGKQEETLGFRQASQKAFIVYLIANIFFYLYYYMMHKFNLEIAEYQRADLLENAKYLYPKDQLFKQLQAIKKADFSVTLWGTIKDYFLSGFSAFFSSFFVAFIHWLRTREK
jgi:hypothetical protein